MEPIFISSVDGNHTLTLQENHGSN